MEESRKSLRPEQGASRASQISLAAGIFISLIKFAGVYVTGSNAILSDALESIVNVLAAAFAAYSIRKSLQKSDSSYLYGQGKIEYISAGFEGGLIILAALVILYESIPQLWVGNVVQRMDLGLLLVVASSLLNSALGWYLIHTGKRYHSEALVADGHHVITDVYSSVGLLVGLGVVQFTNLPWMDPLVAILMAFWILFSGFKILSSAFGRLMDRADPRVLEEVVEAMERHRIPPLIHPHKLRFRESGPRLLVDFHMIMPRYLTVDEVHDIEVEFGQQVEESLGRPVDLLMHTDPCISDDCSLCSVAGCSIRKSKNQKTLPWRVDLLLQDVHHPFMD